MTNLRFSSEAMIDGISAWVKAESPTYQRDAVNRMMDVVAASAAAPGVSLERIAGRDGLADHLLLSAGPANGQKPAVVMSHVDTVHPVGTIESGNPLRRDGDRMYGPGIYDMKAGAYLALQAFLDVTRRGSAKRPLKFLFTSDEEIGSPTSRDIIERLARESCAALVTEPARDGGRIVTSRKGVGRFDVAIEGVPAHSGAQHDKGRSAVREAAHQLLFIEGLTNYATGVTTSVGMIRGGTAANTVPQHCSFCVDLRVASAAEGVALEQMILGLQPKGEDIRIKVSGGMNRPPMEKTPEIAALYLLAQSIGAEFGLDVVETFRTGGGSDGNFTAAVGTPTLDGLGCDGAGGHTLTEYALIPSFAERAQLMAGLLERV